MENVRGTCWVRSANISAAETIAESPSFSAGEIDFVVEANIGRPKRALFLIFIGRCYDVDRGQRLHIKSSETFNSPIICPPPIFYFFILNFFMRFLTVFSF